MKTLILGAHGMIGHVVALYLKETGYEIITTSQNEADPNYYDAFKNVYAIEEIIKREQPDTIINCAGILNQAAEENKPKAIIVNSFLPHFLHNLSKQYHFKLVCITTDCVFSGNKGDYTEDDTPDATSFYGRTKALGEIQDKEVLTLRFSTIGPDINKDGIGLLQWFSSQSGTVKGFSKVPWTGITTIELARVIDEGLKNNLTGLHHAVSGEKIPKADLLRLFEKYFHFGIVVEDDPSYACDKTLTRTAKSYDFKIPDYDTMIKEMYDWVISHQEIYQNLTERMH